MDMSAALGRWLPKDFLTVKMDQRCPAVASFNHRLCLMFNADYGFRFQGLPVGYDAPLPNVNDMPTRGSCQRSYAPGSNLCIHNQSGLSGVVKTPLLSTCPYAVTPVRSGKGTGGISPICETRTLPIALSPLTQSTSDPDNRQTLLCHAQCAPQLQSCLSAHA